MVSKMRVCAAVVALCAAAWVGVAAAAVSPVAGFIKDFHVVSVRDAFGGKVPPGAAGPYQLITATVTGALDPHATANAGIVDLSLAPRDAAGAVEYRSNVLILRPKRAQGAGRVLVYDVANRGGLLGRGTFVGGGDLLSGAPPDADFPSWLQHGYTIVWSGWQGDVPVTHDALRMGTAFPLAEHDGRPVSGPSREEYIPDNAGGPPNTFALSYPPADPARRDAVVFTARRSWRDAEGREDYAAPAAVVRHWRYVERDGRTFVHFTPPSSLPGPNGRSVPPDAGTIYSFVYRATRSRVDGIGFAAVRDLVAFLRYARHDASGHANPLLAADRRACAHTGCGAGGPGFAAAIGVGISQSGRFLRDFLYRGFNRAGDGRRVFDGLMPIIAGARRTWVDTRFAQPGRWSKQHEDHFMRGFRFPFAYNVFTDPVSGRHDGLLAACRSSDTCPKIMQLDGSFEWWNGAASLVVSDGAGHDLRLPANVRYYLVPGTGHGGGAGIGDGLTPRAAAAACRFPDSPVTEAPFERALFARLAAWVLHDRPPPASRYPTVAAGTATAPARTGFPAMLRTRSTLHGEARSQALDVTFRGVHNQVYVTRYAHGVPHVDLRRRYRVLEPKVDATGNEVAGIRTPAVSVPLASYTGWNLRAPGHAEGELCGMHGAMLPLAITAGQRRAGDARPPLAALYTGRADYARKVAAATDTLVRQGYLLRRDAEAIFKARAAQVSPRLIARP